MRPVGGGVPLRRLHVVDGHEGRLAAHGQAHVVFPQNFIHLVAQGFDVLPLRLAVRLGDTRIFVDADDLVHETELALGVADVAAGDRRGADRIGRAGQGNMALAGKQPGSRVQANPTRPRNVHLGPSVKIGEILLRAGRPVQRLHIRRQLHQIARHKTGGQAQMPQDLHQQPGAVAARTQRLLQSLLAGLHPRLHADGIGDVLAQPPVDVHQKIHRIALGAVHQSQPSLEERAGLAHLQIRHQLLFKLRVIFKRKQLGVFLDEKIEGVDNRHFGD